MSEIRPQHLQPLEMNGGQSVEFIELQPTKQAFKVKCPKSDKLVVTNVERKCTVKAVCGIFWIVVLLVLFGVLILPFLVVLILIFGLIGGVIW